MQELKNLGFEIGMPNDWQTYSTGKTHKYTYPEPGRVGGYSVAIEYLTREIGKVAIWVQNVDIDRTKKYKLSGWMKTENIIGTGASMKVDWKDINGQFLSSSAIMSRQKGTISWKYFEGTVTPDQNAVKATIVLDLYDCSGKVWFDDMSFSDIIPPPITNIFYVATNGSDNNPGTESRPFRTIQKSTDIVNPGDSVYVKQGIYNERVNITRSGSVNSIITFKPYSGHIVTIDGSNISLPIYNGLIDMKNVSNIKFSGFRVIDSNKEGIALRNCNNITIEDNYIRDTAWNGIVSWKGNNIIIDSNECERCVTIAGTEIVSMQQTQNFQVKNNNIHHGDVAGDPHRYGGADGIGIKDGSKNGKVYENKVIYLPYNFGQPNVHGRTGIYIDGWDSITSNIDVFNNLVHHTGAGVGISTEIGGIAKDIKIYNNILYENEVGIIAPLHHEADKPAGLIQNVTCVNNTIYKNDTGWKYGIFLGRVQGTTPTLLDNVKVINNILSKNPKYQIFKVNRSGVTKILIDHNLIFGPSSELGTNYIRSDPQFVNETNRNFHLKSTSPAINAGTSVEAPSFDLDNKKRPQGTKFDIGAYEY